MDLEYKNDQLALDLEYNEGVECEGKKYLGALPIMEHIKDDLRDSGGHKSPIEREWDEKLKKFNAEKIECTSATLKATVLTSELAGQSSDSFKSILAGQIHPEDQIDEAYPEEDGVKQYEKLFY
eukprot:CAMPEP_0119051386 /NCGR_PEP_ID=MMETSP1177-20130426/73019_1 /TAXON_ID=2985 /ORGANISM="Ochromonas sp, Strain CCMP1899" /LENGTH=123 /DNA_ID=CAMNT_0007030571 /DNA_START=738 /DNA_END=1110 /DNA_ORIENTATION=+